MATKDIGNLRTRLSWEDDGANRSLADFRRDLRGLRSEMNAARSGGREYTNSLKGMRQQSDILTRRLRTQEEQVRELHRRWRDSARVKGEDATQTKNLASQYNNATAQMNRTESQLQNLNREIRRMESPWTQLGERMTTVGTKMQDVGRNMSAFGRDYSMNVTAPIVAGGAAVFKASMDFETAFAGVEKTVDGTEQQMNDLRQSIRDMAKEIPASTTEIAAVAEAAGQLGIETENIEDFTRTMIDLGEATNMSSEQAATEFARLANITGMAQDDFDKLGSSVVELGNNMATTESEISSMALRLAAQGSQVGMTEAEIVALAGSMSSLGIEAEAGGTAMTTVLKRIDTAVDESGDQLEAFADAAGTSSSEFAKVWENEPIEALDMFISGLGESGEAGENLTSILEDLGISGIRESDTILRLAGSSDTLTEAVELSSGAWEENSALTEEAEQRYKTTESQLKILWNRIKDVGITLGDALIPAVMDAIDAAEPLIQSIEDGAQAFADMDEEQQRTILKLGGLVAAVGPAAVALGGLTTGIGGVLRVGGSLSTMLGRKGGKGLIGSIGLLGRAGPVGLAIAGTGALAYGIYQLVDASRESEEVNIDLAQSLSDQASELQSSADTFDELSEKAKISNDELAELNDLNIRISESNNADEINALQQEYDNLADKSGLSKDELQKLFDANENIIEQSPNVQTSVSETGNAFADSTERVREQIDALRKLSETQLTAEREKLLKQEDEIRGRINEKTEQLAINEQRIMDISKNIDLSKSEIDDRVAEINEKLSSGQLTEQQTYELDAERNDLLAVRRGTYDETLTQLQEEQEQISNTITQEEEKLQKLDQINQQMAEIYLQNAGVSEENAIQAVQNGEAITLLDEQLETLRSQKEELRNQTPAAERNTQEYQEQVGEIDNQIGKLETARGKIQGLEDDQSSFTEETRRSTGEMENLTAEAGRDATKEVSAVGWLLDDALDLTSEAQQDVVKSVIGSGWLLPSAQALTAEAAKTAYKTIDASVTPSISRINSLLSSPVRKTVNVATNIAQSVIPGPSIPLFADGTDNHKGGLFIAGEEGWELGRMGNRWEMLNTGLYDRPRGYEVFPHDESKKIIRALNNMPGYASGARPSGEADRVVSGLNDSSDNTDVVQALESQNTILRQILEKETDVIIPQSEIGFAADEYQGRQIKKIGRGIAT